GLELCQSTRFLPADDRVVRLSSQETREVMCRSARGSWALRRVSTHRPRTRPPWACSGLCPWAQAPCHCFELHCKRVRTPPVPAFRISWFSPPFLSGLFSAEKAVVQQLCPAKDLKQARRISVTATSNEQP